jgi:hypothetical protein
MARFNEILVGRYNRQLQKLLGMKGPASLVTLNEEVHAAFPLFSGVENRYLEQWQRFASVGAPVTAPAAGNRAAWRIRNPAGSNVIGVIEKFLMFANATDQPFLNFNNVATVMPTESTPSVGSTNLDGRGQQGGSTCIISASLNFGAVGAANWQMIIPINTNLELVLIEDQEMVLAPGTQITVIANTLAQALVTVNVIWRERFLEDSERA